MTNFTLEDEMPTTGTGLPADPGLAFDVLTDLMLNLLVAARQRPAYRDALVGRAHMLLQDLEEEVREIERHHPYWWGWAMLTVPGSDFPCVPRSQALRESEGR